MEMTAVQEFKRLKVKLPTLTPNTRRCGSGCTLQDECLLVNRPGRTTFSNPLGTRVNFCGTYCSPSLSGRSYWQIQIRSSGIKNKDYDLCEVGIATEGAIDSSKVFVNSTEHLAYTMRLHIRDKCLMADFYGGSVCHFEINVAEYNANEEMKKTFGFFVDIMSKQFIVFDVITGRKLQEFAGLLSESLYPVLNMVRPKVQKDARVSLTVQTGDTVDISPEAMQELSRHIPQSVEESRCALL